MHRLRLPALALAVFVCGALALGADGARAGIPERGAAMSGPERTLGGAALGERPQSPMSSQNIPDGAGGLIAVWPEMTVGLGARVYAQHIGPDGDTLWATRGIEVLSVPSPSVYAWAITDGAGGCYVVWNATSSGPGSFQVRAQRLGPDGSLLWDAAGVPVATAPDAAYLTGAMPDGQGGALVVSAPQAGTNFWMQRVQHLSPSGASQWGVGVLVGTSTTRALTLVGDGSGGAIAGLLQSRADDSVEVVVQRVTSGMALWPGAGLLVHRQWGYGGIPALAPDLGGPSFHVAWQQQDGIHVQWFTTSGEPVWPVDGVAAFGDPALQLVGLVSVRDGVMVCAQAFVDGGLEEHVQYIWPYGAVRWPGGGMTVLDSVLFTPSIAPGGYDGMLMAGIGAASTSPLLATRVTTNGTEAWAAGGITICGLADYKGSPAISADGNGGALVTWTERRYPDDPIYVSDLFAQRIGPSGSPLWRPNGMCVHAESGDQRFPTAVRAGDGLFVTWQQKRGVEADIVARRFDSSGAPLWAPIVVCGASGAQRHPLAATDGAGGAYVAWEDSRSGVREVFAQHVGADGAALWTKDGILLSDAGLDATGISVAPDSSGGVVVAWTQPSYSAGSVHVERLARDGASAWPEGGGRATTGRFVDGSTALLADGRGGTIVVWNEMRDAAVGWQQFAQRLDAAGQPSWIDGGRAVALTPSSAFFDEPSPAPPCVADDRAGGLYVADDQEVQHIGPDGIALWAAGTLPSHHGPAICSDPAAGVLLAWSEYEYAARATVHAQAAGPDGSMRWPAGGVLVNGLAHYYTPTCLVPDAVGGAIVVWADEYGGADLMTPVAAQRLTPEGAMRWSVAGVGLSHSSMPTSGLSAFTDGSGGALAVWESLHNNYTRRVRLQHVTADGVALWGADGMPPDFVTLASGAVRAGCARLEWLASTAATAARVERRVGDGAWITIATLDSPSDGTLRYQDCTASPSARYGYRLIVAEGADERVSETITLEIPPTTAQLAAVHPNPARGAFTVSFALAEGGAASLELFDVAGRRVEERPLAGLAPGSHTLALGGSSLLRPGIYVVRLSQGGHSVSRRVAVLR